MTILRRLVVALLALGWSAAGHAEDKPKPKPRPREAAGIEHCAVATGSVRMEAYGYMHVVTLRNGCDRPVTCEVWTDVDPAPRYTLHAAPGAVEEVITRRGSPAREVSAEASCHYDS
ncbi:MAG: hypothetical protein QM778_27080 [Myxococcales bacterium]